MKKFLAITLALLMVLSSVVIVSAAEPEYVVLKTILVDNCDTDTVWKDSHPAGSISVDTEDKQEGTGSVAYTRSGAGGAGHFQLRMNLTAREDETAQFINLETIENTRLAFDFYVSDPAPVKDVSFFAELCSDGKPDGEESARQAKFFANCVAGWNTVYIDLATLGNGCNWAHFNFIRIFNQDTADFGDGWTCKIDNVRFEVVGEKPTSGVVDSILVEGCETDVFGGQVSTEQKTEGNSSVKMVYGADQSVAPGAIMWRKVLDTAIDASNMTRFAFDIYVSDPAAFSAFDFCLELTSAGVEDQEEYQIIKSLAKLTETKTLVEGWNTCYINIVDATGCDFSRYNFLRFFSNKAEGGTLGAEVTVYLDNFRFEQYVEPPVDDEGLEIQSFTVFKEDEKNFLVRTNAGDNGNQRFSDGNFETVYKFSVVNRFSVEKVTFTASTNAQLLLQVSQNDKDWTDVYRFEYDPNGKPDQGLPEEEREYDLTPFVDLAKNGDIYIRIADAEPSNGWGGSIFKTTPAKLTVKYTPISDDDLNAIEMAPGEGSIAIYGFNKPSGGMDIDKTDKKAGAASNTFETQKGQVFSIPLPEAIDATGMDTLTFDLYVSDLAYFDYWACEGAGSSLEITSSGTWDKEEMAWNLAAIKANNIGGDLVVGWNHIVLPLETATLTGEPDMTKLNFIRFFMVGGEDEACGITVKIDNMRMDNSGIARAAEQEAKDKEAAAKVDELIDKIGEVTLDSENKINKAEEAYKKLTAAAKKFVTKKDVLDAAKDKYKELVEAASGESADKEAAAKVDELIDKIGEVTVDSESKIKEAEEAYEKLSDAAKKLVTKKDVLDAAKAKYQELTKEPTEAPKEGCASALTVGAGAMMLLAAAWVTMAARKKED